MSPVSHARALRFAAAAPGPLRPVPTAGLLSARSRTVAVRSPEPPLGSQRDVVAPGLLLLGSGTGVWPDQLPATGPGGGAQLQLPPVSRGLARGSGQTGGPSRVG